MALASLDDVEARLGHAPTVDDSVVTALLDEASDLVAAFIRCVPDPVPGEVSRVVARMVVRVLSVGDSVPVGLSQAARTQTAGPVTLTATQSFSETATQRSPWLTSADKMVLRRFGCGGRVQNFPTA